MTQYEENLKALSEAYPQMDALIEDVKKVHDPRVNVTEEKAYNGEIILKVKKEGRICYLNGKRDTREAAQIWSKMHKKLPVNTPVFIMGAGNPAYLEELAQNAENKLTIIIYEPSFSVFLKFLEIFSLKKYMEKHFLLFFVDGLDGIDGKAMDPILRKILSYEKLSDAISFILPNYDVLFPEESVKFLKTIRSCAKDELLQYNTKRLFSSVLVKNILSNAKYLCNAYKTTQLVDVIPRDIPGIVVAAGPSLNKNIKELAHAKGRAFIVAVDTAIKPLLDAGIKPDMFMIVDGKKPLHLVEREDAKEIPLVTTLNAASEILDYHTGMKFFFNEGFTFADTILLRSTRQWGGLESGGSVANNAFSLLHKIGLERIILVGQDLAYTGKKSHADGTFADVIETENDRKYIWVEGNEEESVPTTEILKVYLDWYSRHISAIQEINENFRVINATEGGARVPCTEVMSLKDAIAQECTKEVDIQKRLGDMPPMLDEEDREWAKEKLAEIPDQFQKLAKDAKKAERLYHKLEAISSGDPVDRNDFLSLLKKIKRCIQKMQDNAIYQLIDATMVDAQYILREEQFMYEGTVEEEGKEIARKGILYSGCVKDMAILFEEYARNIFGSH